LIRAELTEGFYLQVEILLVITESDNYFMLNAYTSGSKRPEFKPCGILNSFKNIHGALVFQSDMEINKISTVASLDVERFRQINRNKSQARRSPECLHVLIGKNYSRHSEKIALASSSQSITYAELGKRSAAISHFLMSKGIRAGDTVGLCMDRSVQTIITMVGILRAGAAYAPMDSSSPLGRITQIMEKADIKYVITEDRLRDKFQALKATLIMMSQLKHVQSPSNWFEEANTDISKPVYLMFTSGSTGLPKCVVHGHGAVSLSLLECIEELSINASTRFMQLASLAFDASILEVFAPLAAGGCLCVVSQEERDGDLESVMESLKISHAWLTPSMAPQIQPENLPSLRSLSVGGEPASAELVSTWGERVQLNSIYGTTETGVWDTVKIGMKPGGHAKNIGRGIGSVICWITDPSNVHRLMPFGAEGELLIQSPYVALGYMQDPDREAQTMLDPSFLEWRPLMSQVEGTRVYRTGDLAKYNENGDLIFLGRQTGYVKIRGLRVDLGEVENAIISCLKSGRSAVTLSEHEGQDVEIVAFIETTDYQDDQLAHNMHDQLSKFLPEYMIPTAFVPIESMPLTMSKKIDRQQLRARLSDMSQKELQAYRKGGFSVNDCCEIPNTRPLAVEISNIIADMFESKDEDFAASLRGKDFSLASVGLTSLHRASLVNLIRKKYQKKIKIEDLHKNDLTVCNIEDCLLGTKEPTKKTNQARNLMADLAKLKPKLDFIQTRQATVFLTSITGFLGSQVLRCLLEHPEIKCVIGLVRAKDEEQARRKVQQHGELGHWWQPGYQDRIEAWTGDLSKPRLGLEQSKWDRLFSTDEAKRVDCIIHNGARVNWMDSYEDLELVNIHSTIDILSGLSKMESPCRLIYVSGGYMPMEPESHLEIAKKLSEASGYDQTKFMSQLLLNEYNKHLDRANAKAEKARTVIPGFIVGTRKEGIAHTEDFLWRLAFSIVRLKAVSQDLQYLTVAGVDQVSSLITDVFLYPEQYSSEIINCVDGVTVSTFCDVISRKMQMPIRRMSHQEWMKLLKKDVEEADFNHPFMPVLDWFEDNTWQFMVDQDHIPQNCYFDQKETIVALESSVSYMMDIGYLSQDEAHQRQLDKSAVFTRSSS
jgi:amino acid adenylation domain-containing protein/thioester reductase-like protein